MFIWYLSIIWGEGLTDDGRVADIRDTYVKLVDGVEDDYMDADLQTYMLQYPAGFDNACKSRHYVTVGPNDARSNQLTALFSWITNAG